MAHHPDRLMHATEAARRDGEERMKQINAAYAILNDPARRAQNDRTHPQQLSV
jgi:DnaJ-class molecular chaperone